MKSNLKLFQVLVLMVLGLFLCNCKNSVSLNSLLKEMADRSQLTYFPKPEYKLKQFSSYNRQSVSPENEGWFANMDMSHFIRVEENEVRREFVMFDTKGPGAVVRWWMTFYKAQNGIIRIYLDNNETAVIEGSPKELLSGNKLVGAPFTFSVHDSAHLGPAGRDYDHNFYLPIPFEKHCKITYENDSIVLKKEYESTIIEEGYYWPDVFYNICYREYAPQTKVESFSHKVLEKAQTQLDNAKNILLGEPIPSSKTKLFNEKILPGESITVIIDEKNSAIDRLSLQLFAPDVQQALRSMVISMKFDGKQTVWVPVGEFFGTGYQIHPHETWMNKSKEAGQLMSIWTMPFTKKCELTFHNYGTEIVKIDGEVGLSKYIWKPNSMYFGASWHEYNNLRTKDEQGNCFDLNMIDIKGKGLYVGDQVAIFNSTYHWWGEGDEKIFVDGEKFPSSFGTGTEDYYGYAFGRPEPFSHPFISQPVGNGNESSGLTVNMRHRSLDAIPFNSSISSNIEMWHWADVFVNYAITTYWYSFPSATINVKSCSKCVQLPLAESKSDFNNQEIRK